MNLRILPIAIGCLASSPLWAGAGLTSAGVDPNNQNTNPQEPTLAQVAPVQATNTPAASSGVTATAGAGTPSIAGAPVGNAAGNSASRTTTTTVATLPPPPPDPATLPVSVIRPLNKGAAADAPAPRDTVASSGESAISQHDRHPTPTPKPQASGASVAAASTAPSSPRMATATTRADSVPHARPDAPPVEEADASSGGFIFYAGLGIASVILLLSVGAFLRGRTDESGGS
jgi:hypothetical protein